MAKYLGIAAGAGIVVYGYRRIIDAGKKLSSDQQVVIVGGGYAGARLAKELNGRGDFTLIDPKDALHHNMAALRAAIEPGFAKKTFIPYEPSFGEHFKQGKVIAIDMKKQEVSLENDPTPIPYTQLILATGTSGPFPGKCRHDKPTSQLIQLYENYTNEIKAAKKVVVVGGGAVGVEMAGEIATDYPGQKEVTIVHNSDVAVSPKLVPKAQDMITEKFKIKKINMLYNEKVTNLSDLPINKQTEGLKVKLSSGKVIDADLVIPCFGLYVNSDAYKDALGGSMNERGQLKVNENLEVVGANNVFAIGDCNDYDEVKLASVSQAQGSHVYKNLINIARRKPLEAYKPDGFRMALPIGRDGGLTQSGTKVLGDFMAKFIKAKDVFVSMTWKEMGQKPPK
ncbi:ferroptosis suppressor protein 1-like [Clavelina lepadiformis]|uniref:ferroptosis suppressor protein 1-like n=1 Tax=Clavelina lepadiformis TaxID=159417 RepID=UPI004041E7E8